MSFRFTMSDGAVRPPRSYLPMVSICFDLRLPLAGEVRPVLVGGGRLRRLTPVIRPGAVRRSFSRSPTASEMVEVQLRKVGASSCRPRMARTRSTASQWMPPGTSSNTRPRPTRHFVVGRYQDFAAVARRPSALACRRRAPGPIQPRGTAAFDERDDFKPERR